MHSPSIDVHLCKLPSRPFRFLKKPPMADLISSKLNYLKSDLFSWSKHQQEAKDTYLNHQKNPTTQKTQNKPPKTLCWVQVALQDSQQKQSIYLLALEPQRLHRGETTCQNLISEVAQRGRPARPPSQCGDAAGTAGWDFRRSREQPQQPS